MTQKIKFLALTVLDLESKMDARGDAFPDCRDSLAARDFRSMMFYDYLQGKTYTDSFKTLAKCFGKQAPSLATVHRWFKNFKWGKSSLENDDRCGRPVSALMENKLAQVKSMIKNDPRISEIEMEAALDISSGTLDRFLRDHLKVKKRCSRWIPHRLSDEQMRGRVEWCQFMLTKFDGGRSKRVWDIVTGDQTWIYEYDPETKQQSSVWLSPGETPPQKCKPAKSASKQMIVFFFCKSGHVASIPLLERKTVNAEWYINTCLPEVIEAWSSCGPNMGARGLMLHHDNATTHTVAVTVDYVQENHVQLVTHPPYSPDLTPCDFFRFPQVKLQLKGRQFSTVEEARLAFENAISDLPHSARACAMENWFQWMILCIRAEGRYIKKLH